MKAGILGAAMFLALLAATIFIIERVRVPNIYAVEGIGQIEYTPDQAEITTSIYAENDVSLAAVEEAAVTMRNILGALKAAGVDAADIATADVRSGLLDLSKNERRAPGARRSYYAQQSIVVTVKDIAHVGKALDTIARAGSNHWIVNYTTSNRAKLEAAAREAAFVNAIAAADTYARNGKFKRGKVLKIQDGSVGFPEVDYEFRDFRLRVDHRGLRSVEAVVVTGTRTTKIDTTFDVPPPREETVTANTNVLFEID